MRWLALVCLLIIAAPVQAQQDCGNGLPCGPVPWTLPLWPPLASPTPVPAIYAEGTGVPTSTPTPTETPVPLTATAFFDVGELDDAIATLGSQIEGTALPVYNAQGTPFDLEVQIEEVTDNAMIFLGYARGLDTSLMGPFAPLVVFLIIAFLLIAAFKMSTFIIPFIAAVFGFIRKIVMAILEFIPL